MLPKEMPRAQLLTSNSAIQMMENPFSSLKSVAIPWLSPDLTTLAMDMSLAVVCGVGLFFLLLLLPCFKENPPSPTPVRKNKPRKNHMEKWGQTKSRKKNGALKACRDTREQLEEIHDLVSLLSSHLGKLSDSSSEHLLKGDALGDVVNSASAAAFPSARHCEEDTFSSTASPKASPAPSHEGLQPLASTLSPIQTYSSVPAETQSHQTASQPPELLIPLEHPPPRSLSPPPAACTPPDHDSNSGLPLYNVQISPESTPQSSSPTNSSRVPSPSPALNSDILELLEVVISKRAKLKVGQEIKCPVGSLGNLMKSLGSEQDTAAPQPFWNTKPEQLSDSQEHIFPTVLGGQLQQKCSQLFWGLPFLHSESLVAPARVSGHLLDLPSILFNGLSSFIPIQANVPPQLFSPQPLLHHLVQSQALTPNFPWSPPPPGAEMQARVPPCQSPPMRTCEGKQYAIPPVIQQLECHLLKKHNESQKALPSVVKQSYKVFSHGQGPLDPSHLVNFPGDLISFEFQKKLEHHLQERFTQHCYRTQCKIQLPPEEKIPEPGQADKSCQATQKAILEDSPGWKKGRCPCRVMKKLNKDIESSSEDALDSFTDSSSDSEYVCPVHSDNCPLKVKPQTHSEWGQSQVPVRVSPSGDTLNSSLSSTENSRSSMDIERITGNSSQLSRLDATTRQLLEAHLRKLWVKHKWGLFLKLLKPVNQLTLKRAPPMPVLQEPAGNLACKDCKTNPMVKEGEFQGAAPPIVPREETGNMEGSGTPSVLPSPLLECLRRILCSYVCPPAQGSQGMPLPQEETLLPQLQTCNLVGRSWHRDIVPAFKEISLEPTTGLQSDPGEPLKTDSLSQNVSIREVFRESPPGKANDFREMTDEDISTDYTDSSHLNLRSLDVLKATQMPCSSRIFPKPPQDLCLKEQAESSATSECPPLDVILQDCQTKAFLQNCKPEVLLATHMLPYPDSLDSSHNLSGSSTSIYAPCPGKIQTQQELEVSELQDPWYSKMFGEAEKKGSLQPKVRIWEEKLEKTQPPCGQKPCPAAQVRKPRTTWKKSSLPLPEKEQSPPESHFGSRIKNFFTLLFSGKGKSQADSLQKFKIQSTSTQTQDLPTSRMLDGGKLSGVYTRMSSGGQIQEEVVCAHELPKEFQAPGGRYSNHHMAPSCHRHYPVRKKRVCCHQTSYPGYHHPITNRRIPYWDGRGTRLLPRRPVSLVSHPCHHKWMGTTTGHLVHCPRHCRHVTGVFCSHAYHPSHVVSCGVYTPQDALHSNTIIFI